MLQEGIGGVVLQEGIWRGEEVLCSEGNLRGRGFVLVGGIWGMRAFELGEGFVLELLFGENLCLCAD